MLTLQTVQKRKQKLSQENQLKPTTELIPLELSFTTDYSNIDCQSTTTLPSQDRGKVRLYITLPYPPIPHLWDYLALFWDRLWFNKLTLAEFKQVINVYMSLSYMHHPIT